MSPEAYELNFAAYLTAYELGAKSSIPCAEQQTKRRDLCLGSEGRHRLGSFYDIIPQFSGNIDRKVLSEGCFLVCVHSPVHNYANPNITINGIPRI